MAQPNERVCPLCNRAQCMLRPFCQQLDRLSAQNEIRSAPELTLEHVQRLGQMNADMMALSQRIQALEQTNVHSARKTNTTRNVAQYFDDGLNAQVSRARVQRLEYPAPELSARTGMLRTAVEHIGTYINETNTNNFAAVDRMLATLAADVNAAIADFEERPRSQAQLALMDIMIVDKKIRMLEVRFVQLVALAAMPQRDAFDQQIKQEIKIEESE